MSGQPKGVAYEGQAWDLWRPLAARRDRYCSESCQCPNQCCSSQHGHGLDDPMPHALLRLTRIPDSKSQLQCPIMIL